MDKLFYPALFHKAEEGGFWITFPDFPEVLEAAVLISSNFIGSIFFIAGLFIQSFILVIPFYK